MAKEEEMEGKDGGRNKDIKSMSAPTNANNVGGTN
jgi:hypothetical protein